MWYVADHSTDMMVVGSCVRIGVTSLYYIVAAKHIPATDIAGRCP